MTKAEMKAKLGDRVVIIKPDNRSLRQGVKEGQIGKVTIQAYSGCYAENPLWGQKEIGFFNHEFMILKGGDRES